MNYRELNDFVDTCELLGTSPFEVLGVKPGDLFTANGSVKALKFVQASSDHKLLGVFRAVQDEAFPINIYLHFIDVTPEKPYDFK